MQQKGSEARTLLVQNTVMAKYTSLFMLSGQNKPHYPEIDVLGMNEINHG